MALVADPSAAKDTFLKLQDRKAPDELAGAMGVAKLRYGEMAATERAEGLLLATLIARGGLADHPRVVSAIGDLAKQIQPYYLNPDQYHSAHHALIAASFALTIAPLADPAVDLSPSATVRRTTTLLFHDLGNGRFPGQPGRDELAACELYLRCTSPHGFKEGTFPFEGSAAKVLQRFSAPERVQAACHILGSVFRDRFCSVDRLKQLDYVQQFAQTLVDVGPQLGIYPRDLRKFQLQHGTNGKQASLIEAIAKEMTSPEALILKHADLCGSLSATDALKNHVLNRWEDRYKPNVKDVREAGQYHLGFVSFIQGSFHVFAHQADTASPYLAEIKSDPTRVFFGLGDKVANFGRQGLNAMEASMKFWQSECGELLGSLHALACDGHDIGGTPIGQLVTLISSKTAGVESHSTLNNLSERDSRATVASITSERLNLLFNPRATNLPIDVFPDYEMERRMCAPED